MHQLTGEVGLIGDVHQEDRLLERVLRCLADRDVNAVLCAGDVLDGRGSPGRTIDLLSEAQVCVVRGNHDRWYLGGVMRELPDALPVDALALRHRRWLEGLAPTRRFETPLGGLLLCHGTGSDDMRGVRTEDDGYTLEANEHLRALIDDPDIDLVVAGHTHRRMVRDLGGLTVINAGTLLPAEEPCFGILDLATATVTFLGFDSGAVVQLGSQRLKPPSNGSQANSGWFGVSRSR